MTHCARFLSLVVLTVLGACSSDPILPNLPSKDTLPSILDSFGDTAHVTVPDTMVVGLPSNVIVRTIGGGFQYPVGTNFCVSVGSTTLVQANAVVNISPVDIVSFPKAGQECNAAQILLDHVITVTPTQPGALTIQILGRRLPGDNSLIRARSVYVKQP